LCNFLHSPVTSSLLGPNNPLSTLYPNTLSLCSSLSVTDQVSHPYKTTSADHTHKRICNHPFSYEIWGSHSGKDVVNVLGCGFVWTSWQIPMFRRNKASNDYNDMFNKYGGNLYQDDTLLGFTLRKRLTFKCLEDFTNEFCYKMSQKPRQNSISCQWSLATSWW
jgi:hypothetical protein